MADGKVNIQVGYTVDKSGLEEMQSLFQRIASQADNAGTGLSDGLKKATTTAHTLDQILEKTFNTDLGTLNVTKFNQEMQKAGLTMKSVKADLTGVGNEGVQAYNRLTQAILGTNMQLKQSSKLLDQMFITFKNTVRYGISSSIFNNFTNSISRAYSYVRDLDTSLNNIRIVTEKSADEMDKFAEKANSAAKTLSASTLDYTNAALIYYQQGLSDQEAQARAETTVKVANVTGQAGREVSEQLTAVWNGYKVSAEETEVYVDKLAAVAASTAADLQELSIGMSKVASAAQAMGVDFDDLNAQIATIVSVTRQAPETVGTALKTIYARLGDLKVDGVDEFGVKLGEITSQMHTMGIEVMDQNGNMRNMTSVMAEVAEKWNTWTQAQRQAAAVAMAGKRQYNNLIALFNNWEMYSDALQTSTEALGTLQKQQDTYMESTNAKLKKLKATWQDLYTSIGDTKTINTFIDLGRNIIQVFDNFSDSFGGGLKTIAGSLILISNIFSKQIVQSIGNAILRADVLKQNLQTMAALKRTWEAKIAESPTNDPDTIGAVANSEKQFEISKKIYDVRAGLTQEERNTAIEYQKQLGFLEEQRAKSNAIIEKEIEQNNLKEEYDDILQMTRSDYELELSLLKEGLSVQEQTLNVFKGETKEVEKTFNELNKLVKAGTMDGSYAKKFTEIFNQSKGLSAEAKQRLSDLVNENTHYSAILKKRNKILEIYKEEIKASGISLDEQKKQVAALEKILDEKEKINDVDAKSQNLNIQLTATLEQAAKVVKVGSVITTITSSLTALAMAFSSVNSLIQTWTDETASFGDKLTQTFTTVIFTLPMVISAFTKLYEVRKAMNTLRAKEAIQQGILNGAIDKENTSSMINLALKKFHVKLTKEDVTSIAAEAAAEAALTTAKGADVAVTEAEIVAQEELNAVRAADPVFLIIAALAAMVVAATAVVKIIEKQREATIKNNKARLDEIDATQAEVNANKELYDSFEQVYDKYKEGLATKDEMAEATVKLAEKYHLEGVELAKLTGKYDDLAKSVKEYRKQELEKVKQQSKEAVEASKENLQLKAADLGNVVDSGIVSALDEQKAYKIAKKMLGYKYRTSTITKIDYDNIEEVVNYYNLLKDTVEEMNYELTVEELKNSEIYHQFKTWIEELTPYVDKYKESLDELDSYEVESIFTDIDFEQISSIDEYNQKINLARVYLEDLGKTEEEAEKAVSAYISTSTNEYAKIGKAIEELIKKYPKLAKLSNEYKQKALYSNIDFDIFTNLNEAELQKLIDAHSSELKELNLEVPISLREKITSTKKLNKTEVEEALKQEGILEKDYSIEMADFDNQSAIEQLDNLNNIIIQTVNSYDLLYKEKEKQYEIDKKSLEIEEERTKQELENIKKELENLENKKNNLDYDPRSSEGQEQLDLLEQEIDYWKYKEKTAINYYNIISDNMNKINEQYEQIIIEKNSKLFQGLLNETDGLISKVKILKDVASSVGEGWAISADKIEDFAKNFPEIMENQKNYNYLQDGSVHLTEEGQEVFKNTLELRKNEIILQAKAYKQELQIEADKKYALYEYYKGVAKALQKNLDGEIKDSELQEELAKNVAEYKVRMMEATGKSDKELNTIIQENAAKTSDKVISTVEDQFNAYVQLGEAIQAAYSGGQMPTWSDSKKTSSAPDISKHTVNNIVGDLIPQKLTTEQKQELQKLAEAQAIEAYNAYSTAISKIAATDGQIDAMLAGFGAMGKGKAGKDKKQEKFDDEFDRYYDIKNAIELVGKAMEKVEKIQSKLHGKELIQSLKNENKLIKQQIQNYEALYAQQQVELTEVQGTLMSMGGEFDNQGFLTNYASLTASALEQYQAKIAEFNAGKINEATKTAYEESYNQLKKYIDRYNDLFYSEMQDTREKLDDSMRQVMENNLQIWETELKVNLDVQDAKRKWADFLKDIEYDFRKVYRDLSADAAHFALKMETYSGFGTIETDLNAIKDIIAEIDKIQSGQGSDMFESISDAQEKLKELDNQLETDAKDMKELWEDAWNTYLDGIDQSKDKLSDLGEQFERINQELEFQSKLIELLYGDEAYKMLDSLYKGQERFAENQISSVKAQVDMWHQLWAESGATLENQSDWTEDQKRYYEEWMDAQETLNGAVTDYIELLKNDYLNAVNDILKELETALSKSSLENIATQWGRITKDSDKYYDSIEQAYEAQKFANKIDQEIAKTTNVKNQQKLMALRDREVNYLREKANLTKYDLDAAETRYQIAVKEMALEDARQNKTSMKLVRNEQGNWSYQYMADLDDVEAKQDDILQSYGDLYKLAGDAYQNNLDALQNLQSEYLESARKIYEDMYMSEQEKEERLEELRIYYFDQYAKLAEENQLYRNDLATAGAGLLLQIYQQDEESYQYMIDSEQSMLDTLINSSIENYQDLQDKVNANYYNIGEASRELMEEVRSDWTASAQLLADSWNADDGVSVKVQVISASVQISKAMEDYKLKVDWCAQEIERDFGEQGITGAINRASSATDDLKRRTEILVFDSEKFLNGLKIIINEVGDAWLGVQSKVAGAINQVQQYLNVIGKVRDVAAKVYNITGGAIDFSSIIDQIGGDGGDDSLTTPSAKAYAVFDGSSGVPMSNYYATREEANQKASELSKTTGRKSLGVQEVDTALMEKLFGMKLERYTASNNISSAQAVTSAWQNFTVDQLWDLLKTANNGLTQAANTLNTNTINENGDNFFTVYFPNVTNNIEELKNMFMNLPNITAQFINK